MNKSLSSISIIRQNLEYGSLSHNWSYSQSKTKNLASNHINNHKQEQKSEKHD